MKPRKQTGQKSSLWSLTLLTAEVVKKMSLLCLMRNRFYKEAIVSTKTPALTTKEIRDYSGAKHG